MNYGANMPDWHQYNTPQSGVNDITSTAQNVNSGHLPFISSINTTQLNSLNLGSEGLEKHQNDSNFNPRHFQPHLPNNISHGHNATDNTPLASMVQMQNCIGHYGPSNTRNPMADNLSGSIDPRNAVISGLNEELGYRNSQVPLNGPISHLNGPNVMNMNGPHGSIGPRTGNVNSHAANRTGPSSYVHCKGLCCNPDPNISYQQWEKYCSYQNNTTYRQNIRSSAYQTDTRRFGNDFNFRKDNFDNKEVLPPVVSNSSNTDHRRNFAEFKYRKDRILPRSYPSSAGMLQNYPMQNCNYTGEYQKYSYNVKEYSKVNMNVPNQGIVKHPEQSFVQQQKYNSKQVSYQNNGMLSNSVSSTNVNPNMISTAQNSYFNPQYPRNLSTETSHDCQESVDNVSIINRTQTTAMHTPHSRYQVYQQKLAMQRFSMENHLREFTRIPGYQSHPKYKEYVLRYREILKLQQSVSYQGQIQQAPCVTASPVGSSVPPINLQFDQNGVLINSNYLAGGFPKVQNILNPQTPVEGPDKQSKQDSNSNIPEIINHNMQKPEQLTSQPHDIHATALCSENIQKQTRYPIQKALEQNQFEIQKSANDCFDNLSTNTADSAIQQKISKEFADKPDLDVRQFLANWDESEDEDGSNSNLSNVVLANSTPVVVVGYENVDISTKTLESLENSKSNEISSSVITFENQDTNNIGPAGPMQECLTISYSSADNVAVAKNSCKEVTKESIVRPGSIIQCISNGPDEVPTIHIVDNLEISNILHVANGQIAETLEKTAVEANTVTSETEKKSNDGDDSSTEYNANLDNLNRQEYMVENNSSSDTTRSTSQTSRVNEREIATISPTANNNLDSARDANLKKQSSFTSDESHNPDDISLPDLPTSECTPISTTLNTPIHSDSEESSERVDDLTISTNPIEIIQNSPMISFSQSSIKGQLYDHLDGEGTAKNKPCNSLEIQYQVENRLKNNAVGQNSALNTFKFSTDVCKSDSTTNGKSDKECTSSNGISISTNHKTVFPSNSESESTEATSASITLTSAEYELKIVSTDMQNKTTRSYKNSLAERRIDESQVAVYSDEEVIQKKLQIFSETGEKSAPRCSDTTEPNNKLQNIASNSETVELDRQQNHVDCIKENEERPVKSSTNANERIFVSNEITDANITEDRCLAKITKNTPFASYNKNSSALNNDKSRTKEDLSQEKYSRNNKSMKIDMKNSQCAKVTERKRATSFNAVISNRSNETIPRNEQEATLHQDESCRTKTFQQSNVVSRNESKLNMDKDNDESRKRMRFLKEYRRKKYKSLGICESQSKNKNAQKMSDSKKANKKPYSGSSAEELAVAQLLNGKQISEKDERSAPTVEQENNHAILKTIVTKNMNPDFAIQVTNVNLKLQDKDHRRELQHSRDEAKNSGSLDAIKIEINVSCTERNTTEKLLHENIKNAVAETIGHLTNSISNGARSSSTVSTEKQCDKKISYDQEDPGDSTKHKRPPSVLTEISSCYKELVSDHKNTDITKRKSTMVGCKETLTNDGPSGSSVSKKKGSSLERELINDAYDNDTSSMIVTNTCIKPPSSVLATIRDSAFLSNTDLNVELTPENLNTSKAELAMTRRWNLHRNAFKKRKTSITDSCANNEQSKTSSDNSMYVGSMSKNENMPRKEDENLVVVSLRGNVTSSQENMETSMLNTAASTSSNAADPILEASTYGRSTYFDYDHFDVAPNESANTDDKSTERWKKARKDDEKFYNLDLYGSRSGYINPLFFNVNELDNLNTVPVYTTKDGKITYSPNPRFTYRQLIMEARAREDYIPKPYYARSLSSNFYCSKIRRIFKRKHDIGIVDRKMEIDSTKTKSQSVTTKHIDYSTNKNTVHKNNHCTKKSRLEFFNDDADGLYNNEGNQQDGKNSSKRNIVDLSSLEKLCNPDSKSTYNIKQNGSKVLADNLDYKKECTESPLLDSNLFLGSKTSYWEETMESVESYSSHIDKRSREHFKELNFSEMFTTDKRLDSFPFLPLEGNPLQNSSRKANVCNTTNERTLCETVTCPYTHSFSLARDSISPNERKDIVTCDKEEQATAVVVNELANADNILNDEYADKTNFRSDKVECSTIVFSDTAQPCSSIEATKEQDHILEKDPYLSPNYRKNEETATIQTKENDDESISDTVTLEKNKSDAEDARLNKNLLDEQQPTETVTKSAFHLNEQNDNNDTARDASNVKTVENKHLCQRSLDLANCKDVKVVSSVMKSNLYQRNECTDEHDGEELAFCQNNERGELENLSDVLSIEQLRDKEDNTKKLKKLENEERTNEDTSKDQGNDETDNCNRPAMVPEIVTPLEFHSVCTNEKDPCDLFTSNENERNISEFTVIKSIIKSDQTQHQEFELKNNPKDCDTIIDTKVLCMDSSDCGIYVENRCSLAQLSEHDFTDDDSMVPMEWETSQIQEDAVKRLCGIDESSIDFAGATNSLLENLSPLPKPVIKESRICTATDECNIEKESDEPLSIAESTSTHEQSKATSSSDGNKEETQVSSNNYEKIAYLRATDCNANTKMVPKLVIKKTEINSKFITRVDSAIVTHIDTVANKSSLKVNQYHPKIPKMIIRNARSRPGTPSIEAVPDPDKPSIASRNEISGELCGSDSESSLCESYGHRNKIPKMKIKLEERRSSKAVRDEETTQICVKRKSIKKIKIKNSSRTDIADNSPFNSTVFQESSSKDNESKIPILKLKRQERTGRSPSPEIMRKRQHSSSSEVSSKKFRKHDEHAARRNNLDSTRASLSEYERRKNPPLVRISEKIPKVIIKRTSASAEFKCELSKSCKNVIVKSAKWQPEVKLQRYRILDSMVKDLRLTLSPESLRSIDEIFAHRKDNRRSESDHEHRKLSRSNSTSNLLPIKCKQRRMSDYDSGRFGSALKNDLNFVTSENADSRDMKVYATPKRNVSSTGYDERTLDECQENGKDDATIEPIAISLDNAANPSILERYRVEKILSHRDECKTDNPNIKCEMEEVSERKEDTSILVNHNDDFRSTLNETEEISRLSGISSEKVNSGIDENHEGEAESHVIFSNTNKKKLVIKNELLHNLSDTDNECSLQDDVNMLREDTVHVSSNFAIDNSVIKVDSSDESQTTIEILPASPDISNSELDNRIIEDGDSEQLYPADAIPTQFELELEIADNSNADIVDVPMPKLDPMTCYNLHHVFAEKRCRDETSADWCCNESESLSNNKSSAVEDKRVEMEVDDEYISSLKNNAAGAVESICMESRCDSRRDCAETKKSFCCNDILMKEVLAAKETLKKCLSIQPIRKESNVESNARPKTAAEKKQGSSFNRDNRSEASNYPAACRSDVTLRNNPVFVGCKRKTESISNAEKSDTKHSKASNSSSARKKLKLSDKKEHFIDSKEMPNDTRECTTISLKTIKRIEQVASSESLIRVVNSSERKRVNLTERNNISVSRMRDSYRKDNDQISSKILKVSQTVNEESESSNVKRTKTKEDNMPILQPEITVNFDTNSDRDSSRSPPVITNQDSGDFDTTVECKQIDDKVITPEDNVEIDTKDIRKINGMTIVDFVTQLAYHEKATIKHRRYCNLCEKWFPTTSRHRRHLAGYQHRHLELTQRRSIHALFMLFTGKPCPRLSPANVVRSDCSVGELTPLQLAVQDVTKCSDRTQQSLAKQNDVDK